MCRKHSLLLTEVQRKWDIKLISQYNKLYCDVIVIIACLHSFCAVSISSVQCILKSDHDFTETEVSTLPILSKVYYLASPWICWNRIPCLRKISLRSVCVIHSYSYSSPHVHFPRDFFLWNSVYIPCLYQLKQYAVSIIIS